MPSTSRLEMGAKRDLLSLAYNTFFSELEVPLPSQSSLPPRFWITGRGRPGEDLRLTLQLCLKSGETLETGAGRKMLLGKERLELSPEELGGWIRHHGWTLRVGRRGSFGPSTRTTPTRPSRKPTGACGGGLVRAAAAHAPARQLRSPARARDTLRAGSGRRRR